MTLEEKTLNVKPRTLFSTSNSGFPIHDEQQDSFVMIYNKHFPLEIGTIVKMEGEFWNEVGHTVIVASRGVGFYRVSEIDERQRPDDFNKDTLFDQKSIKLHRLGGLDYQTDEKYVVVPKEGCY